MQTKPASKPTETGSKAREDGGIKGWRTWDDDLCRLRLMLEEALEAAQEAEVKNSGTQARCWANVRLTRALDSIIDGLRVSR